jgi:hypothetical protein
VSRLEGRFQRAAVLFDTEDIDGVLQESLALLLDAAPAPEAVRGGQLAGRSPAVSLVGGSLPFTGSSL